MMRRRVVVGLWWALLLAAAAAAHAQSESPAVAVHHVQGRVYMLVTPGGNVAVQAGEDGVLVVDTGSGEWTDQIVAAISAIAPGRAVRYVVNTHVHLDHTAGNEALAWGGEPAAVGGAGADAPGPLILAHEHVQLRMGRERYGQRALPFSAWPTHTFMGEGMEVFFNGEAVQMLHAPAAHTDGDAIVFFRRSDVVVAGDLFSTVAYPVIDIEAGGSINGVIAALNRIIGITVPRRSQEGGTYVIPGHGRLVDEAEVAEYRDMVTIVRDRIADMLARGMTLEQVQAARPTRDYDGRWAAAEGPSSVWAFVEAVYVSLRAGNGSR